MAGEWLKLEACTPEKSEVLAITARMGWDDADLTVGKLFRIWRWFDQQTTDGNACGVTTALLDRIVGVSGFCEAVHSVGWLCINETGISLPNFERHNGNTAKSRALTAKRVANHKANAKGNAQGNAETVSSALPREEKKREEIPTTHVVGESASQAPKPAKRATQLPADFYPNETGVTYAEQRRVSMAAELEKFRNHHAAKGTTFKDWQAAWRTWCDKAVEFGRAGKATATQAMSFAERDEQARRRRWEEMTGRKWPTEGESFAGETIDATTLEIGHEPADQSN